MWCKICFPNVTNDLHVSTDQAVVGSQGRVIKAPVVQVILSGVKIPVRANATCYH